MNYGCGFCGRTLAPPSADKGAGFWACAPECYLRWFTHHFNSRKKT